MRAVLVMVAVASAIVCLRAAAPARGDGVSFPDVVDHFKYGSIGAEENSGLPYWIWRVLPHVCEEQLPKRPGTGDARLGFIDEGAAHGRPVGTSFRPGRGDRVGLNCAQRATWARCARRPTGRARSSPACPPTRWTCRATRAS